MATAHDVARQKQDKGRHTACASIQLVASFFVTIKLHSMTDLLNTSGHCDRNLDP